MSAGRFFLAVVAALGVSQAAFAQEDPNRYLEDVFDPRTGTFFTDEGAKARAFLDAIPERGALAERLRALSESMASVTAIKLAASRIFYLKLPPQAKTAVLCMRETLTAPEKVILDPERLAAPGETAKIEWYVPSPDAKHVAYGLARKVGEPVLKVLVVDKRTDLPLEIERARFNGELAWHPDGRSFYYARSPETGERARRYANIRLYRHQLGRESAKDEVVFAPGVGGARDVPEFVLPSLALPLESRFAYAVVREGVRREIALHIAEQRDLAAGRPRWRKIAGIEDQVIAIEAYRDDLFVLSAHGAPRHRVLRLKAHSPEIAKARVAIPQGDSTIEQMALARDALYLRTSVGGVDRLERLELGLLGTRGPEFLRTAFDTSISEFVAHPRRPGALIKLEGWVEAPIVADVDAKSGNLHDTKLQAHSLADFTEVHAVRLYAPSPDGVRIPVTLIYPKATQLTSDNPTLITAYGAYGVSLSPNFDPSRLVLLDRGTVLAFAHVRGGGENGAEWHEAARGKGKIETIRDLVSVAQFLIDYGFTNAKRLAVQGEGAGGIAVGGALVARPELFAAVVARSPMLDMERYERGALGPFSAPEFGAAAAEASPYAGIRDVTSYPAVMLSVRPNDAIEPWHSAKMIARLQSVSTSGKPALLRVGEAGDGREAMVQELADIDTFVLQHVGNLPKKEAPGT